MNNTFSDFSALFTSSNFYKSSIFYDLHLSFLLFVFCSPHLATIHSICGSRASRA
jgi:hypothetical protein